MMQWRRQAMMGGLAAGVLAGLLPHVPAKEVRVIGDAAALKAAAHAPTRMTSEYASLVDQLRGMTAAQRKGLSNPTKSQRFVPVVVMRGEASNEIESYISLERWDDAVRQAVVAAGAEVVAEDSSRLLVQAWIPLDKVEEVAAIDGVRQLRRPSYGIPAAGTIQTEGDTNLGTNFLRGVAKVDGTGVRVGVISVGLFNQLFPASVAANFGSNSDERMSTGNLPKSATDPGDTFRNFGAITISPSAFARHDMQNITPAAPQTVPEGSAILETLYDLAPGAKYFYADGRTDVELGNARSFLIGQGVDLIVDDMQFFDAGRFDGTSSVSRQAQRIVLEKDIAYVVAAGNYTVPPAVIRPEGLSVESARFPIFINGRFSPLPGVGVVKFHNFSEGRNPKTRDEVLYLKPQAQGFTDGGTTSIHQVLDVVLVWDDVWDDVKPRAKDDLDLYVVPVANPSITSAIASSTDIQNNSGRPVERITQVFPTDDTVALVINRKNSSNSARTLFSLMIVSGTVVQSDVNYLTHGVALNNGDALPPVISVGAIDATEGINRVDPQTVPGTDPGPGRAYEKDFVSWYEDQVVPAVVSYSNTLALSARYIDDAGVRRNGRITGSSGGAAHIGGLVALLRQSFPTIQAYRYYDILRNSTASTTTLFANATRLQEDELSAFKNAPVYLRPNGFDTWTNVREQLAAGTLKSKRVFVSVFGDATQWTSSGPNVGFTPPVFTQGPEGLGISPGGKTQVFGFWQCPVLTFPDAADGVTKAVSPEKLYVITARVGTDETDPKRVPPFRLRVITGGSDEAVTLSVTGVHAEAALPPTTMSGNDYHLYYRPSNAAIGAQGFRVALDLLNFEDSRNADATIYLRDLSVDEVAVPE